MYLQLKSDRLDKNREDDCTAPSDKRKNNGTGRTEENKRLIRAAR